MFGSSSDGESKDFNFVMALGVVALVALLVVFYVYRVHFSGAFSTESGEWSDFGGYFGGVLGPIISLLTLATVFKTVLLQREMIRLQNATFKSQIEQAERLSLEARRARLDSRKSIALDVVDRMVASLVRDVERLSSSAMQTLQVIKTVTDQIELERFSHNLRNIQARIDELERNKLGLDKISFDISMQDYSSLEEFEADFYARMRAVYPSGAEDEK